jgi:hypothetical protein
MCYNFHKFMIWNLEPDQERLFRQGTARTKGLDISASWDEIIKFNAEQERKQLVTEFGLRKMANWKDIIRANDKHIESSSPWKKRI